MSPHLVSPLISIDGSHEKKEEEKKNRREREHKREGKKEQEWVVGGVGDA